MDSRRCTSIRFIIRRIRSSIRIRARLSTDRDSHVSIGSLIYFCYTFGVLIPRLFIVSYRSKRDNDSIEYRKK